MEPAARHDAGLSPPSAAASVGPLSAGHLEQLAAARHASRKLRRTAAVARFSAWSTGILGAITLLGVLFGDVTSLVLAVALMAVAVREGWLAGRLALLHTGAPSALAVNQLALGGIIVVYAAWQLRGVLTSGGLSAVTAPTGDPQVDAMLGDFGALAQRLTVAFYLVVAVAGGVTTGLMALYYHSRRAMLDAFVARTPPWVIQVMRTG
ncbi:MAG: hypothetical protein ACKVU4_09200 [Phycisphaerales bacterium]